MSFDSDFFKGNQKDRRYGGYRIKARKYIELTY